MSAVLLNAQLTGTHLSQNVLSGTVQVLSSVPTPLAGVPKKEKKNFDDIAFNLIVIIY